MNYDELTKEQLLGIHKDALEYVKEQEQEIERLNNKNKQWENKTKILETDRNNWESKFYNEAKKNDKAIEYIKGNCILSDCWKDLDFCEFVPIGKIKYKALSSKKVKDLLNILQGSDKE